jgi:RHS repeat-associated protein
MRRSNPRHATLNRLTTETNVLGKTHTYTYDVTNQRIAKTVDLDGQGANPATTTRFVYDRNNVALEFTGSATVPSTRYFHGTNVDQVLAQESSNTTTWLLSDQIGTTRDLVNNSGALLNHFTYDSFGTQTGSTPNATVDTRYKFTGREFDDETGDYFYRSRYYDPEVGRFLGEDAIGFGGGDANLYRYVGNDPINGSDPFGMKDARWPLNFSVTNNSSSDIYILESNETADNYLILPRGRSTPDAPGRSMDTDGVWLRKNNKWLFYPNGSTITPNAGDLLGGSGLPYIKNGGISNFSGGGLVVTNSGVYSLQPVVKYWFIFPRVTYEVHWIEPWDGVDECGVDNNSPASRGRPESRNPPNLNKRYPIVDWHSVDAGDAEDIVSQSINAIERAINATEGATKYPSSWRWNF